MVKARYKSAKKGIGSEANQQLISALEGITDGFVSLDKEMRCTYMNSRAGEIFGKDPAQMTGKFIWREVPEESVLNLEKTIERVMYEGIPAQLEEYYPSYDKWFINRIFPAEEGISILIQDITKNKKTEIALKRSEEKFNKAFYNAPVAITISRASDGTILDVNDGIQLISGFKREEIIGKSSVELHAWESLENRNQYLSILKEKGRINNFDAAMRLKTGEIRNFEISGEMYESDGELVVVSLFRDVTDRKKAEEKLRARERELSLIYSNVHDAIYFLQAEPGDAFRFLSVNSAFLTMTGLEENQVINKLMNEIIPDPFLSVKIEKFKKSILEKSPIYWESNALFPSGSRIGRFSVTPLFDKAGLCTHLIGTVHDITEIKEAEEQIRKLNQSLELRVTERTSQLESAIRDLSAAKEQAESADKLKSEFLSSVSHELRTPLNSIIGFTGILLNGFAGALNEEQTKQLKMVQSSGRHLLSLINGILDLSRIESEKVILNPEKIDLPKIMEEVIEEHLSFALDKNISIIFERKEETVEIESDRQRVKQVLINLMNNAVKFTEIGSVTIRCFKEADFARVEVSDTGIGIDEEHLNQLFRPFVQVENRLTGKFQGSGLGLSISRKIMELLHGTITVKSEAGVGSVFTCSFPLQKNFADKTNQ